VTGDYYPNIERVGGFALVGALFSILSERTRNAIKGRLEYLERYRSVADSIPDYAIFTADPQGRILSCNSGAEQITGFREAEITGHPLSILDAPEDATPDKLRDELGVAAANGRSEQEVWQTRKDGSRFWARGVIAALRNEAGQLSGFAKLVRDLTENKAAVESIERSQRFLQNIIDISPSIIYVFDIEKRKHVFVNRSAAAALGYDPWQVEAVDFVSSVMHPDHWDAFLDYLRRLANLHGEETAEFEYRMRHKDGAWRWFHSRDKIFTRNADGSVKEIIGAATDITERKHVEERLKDSDDRYRAFIANSSEGIWRYELDQPIPVTLSEDEQLDLFFERAYIAECNDVFLRAHGYSNMEQVRRWRLGELLIQSDPEKVIAYLRAFIRVGYRLIGAETREVDMHGNTGYFLTNVIGVLENGMLVRAWGTQREITEQKRAEAALRESEERFAKAFHASPDALSISRIADGVILEVNDSFMSLFGFTRDELIGKSTLALDIYVDPAVRGRALEILEKDGRIRDFEFEMKRKSGELMLIQFSAERLELHGEQCWLAIGRDIAEQRRAEKEREQLLLKAETARNEAEAANRMKDQFLATISHELRTPLTAILGWAHMLTGGALKESQARHAFEVIQRSAELQSRLVDDILDTARIITGRFNLEANPIEVGPVLQAAVDAIRPSAEAKRISLQVVSDKESSTILGDASRVQQIFWNLLSNAVKFTNEGGRVEARLTQSADSVEVAISDTGVGIEPQFLRYVFDRFRQADSTSTRRYGGLGLGLAIVRHLAELHGGSVSVSSPGIGRGSTFKVHFPAMCPIGRPQPESVPAKPESKQLVEGSSLDENPILNGVHVLVVDDDPETLEMLKFILERSQAEVTTAVSVAEALRALEQSPADVLVSDLAMPMQDGYDLIRQVRSLPPEHGGNIPAVALSAYTRDTDRLRALAAGFHLHLSKPVAPSELVSAVATMVGRKDRNAA
jgi:PAS domain S-box-containing protein